MDLRDKVADDAAGVVNGSAPDTMGLSITRSSANRLGRGSGTDTLITYSNWYTASPN